MEYWEPPEAEEEYTELAENLKVVDQQMLRYYKYSLPYWDAEVIHSLRDKRSNEEAKHKMRYSLQVLAALAQVCIPQVVEENLDVLHMTNEIEDLYPIPDSAQLYGGSELRWRKADRSSFVYTWVFTQYLCKYATIPIPGIPLSVQREISSLLDQRKAIRERMKYLEDNCRKRGVATESAYSSSRWYPDPNDVEYCGTCGAVLPLRGSTCPRCLAPRHW